MVIYLSPSLFPHLFELSVLGATLWDPLKLIDQWDNRAAAFFASASFCLATLGTNISANR